jgi:hypothetical protein
MKQYTNFHNYTNFYNFFLIAALCAILLPACNKDEIEYNKPETPLALSLSAESVTLNIRTPGEEALSFSWTSGTNGGTNAAINYLLQIDKQGNEFNDAVTIDIGRRSYTHAYTNVQLNDLLLGNFNATPDNPVALEARVLALVASENASDQISEVIPFAVTIYKPVSTTLYMIGDATPGGWSLDNATVMNPISNEAGGFVVVTNMVVGNFKFVTTTDDFLPSYNKDAGAAELKLIFRQNDSDPDEPFHIDKTSRYRIAVNIIDLTISIEEQQGPRYNNLYLVGDLTGWSFIPMTQNPLNLFEFRYGGILSGSGDRDFKFGTTAGSWDNMLHPTIPNAPITHQDAGFINDDYKWVLTPEQNNKAYKIVVNITEGQETMTMAGYTPYTTLYVIGGASPIGWTLDDRAQAQMTVSVTDIYTYTWTGPLGTGEIKFKCSDDNSWDNDASHPWYMAPEENLPVVLNTEMIVTSGAGDRKWIVQEAGNYTITINQLTEKITFTKN